MQSHPHISDLESIIDLQQAIATSTLSQVELMTFICERTMALTNADGSVVELVENDDMVYRASAGSLQASLGLHLKRDQSLSGLSVKLNEVLYCQDSETDTRVNREACRKVGARSMICVPLIYENSPVGVLKVVSAIANNFTENDVKCLRLIASLLSATIAKDSINIEKEKVFQSLRESENKFRLLIESAHDGVLLSKNGQVIEANPAFCNLFGYAPQELIGVSVLIFVSPIDQQRVADSIKNKVEKPYKLICVRKDGTPFHVEVIGKHIQINGEEVRMTTMRDISDIMRTEQALKDAMEKSLQMAKVKSEFLANMSHEIRTPLNGILGMVSLLRETELTEEQKKFTQVLKTSADNLLILVNDILDFSKIEAKKLTVEKVNFNLKQTIEEVHQLLLPLANSKNLKFHYIISANVAADYLGDPYRLKQILINLCNNALKFTLHGEIKLDISLRDNNELEFKVSDTGIGIPPQRVEDMFNPFVQDDTSTTRKFGGTGLGLSITKHLVELMDGSINVSSVFNKGSTFTVILPLPAAAAQKEKAQPVKSDSFFEELSKFPMNLLLVDDNEENRFLITTYLKKLPITVDIAENGKIALEKMRLNNFDIVLMDIQMPVMDGLEATLHRRKFEADHGLPRTTIIALSAHAMEEERQKSAKAGCDLHLTKPISKKVLFETLLNLQKDKLKLKGS